MQLVSWSSLYVVVALQRMKILKELLHEEFVP